MESNGGAAEVGKKRRQEEDRLSILPDPIIVSILSFLDTEAIVRTSVLSSLFRNKWKAVPALHFLFNGEREEYSDFETYVDGIMSVRDTSEARSRLSSASLTVGDFETTGEDVDASQRRISQFARYVEYALVRGTEDLIFCQMFEPAICHRFSTLFGANSPKTVRSLSLGGVHIDRGFPSFGFGNLETLELNSCLIDLEDGREIIPFASFSRLSKLVLDDCRCRGVDWEVEEVYSDETAYRLKISGTRLLSLDLVSSVACSMAIDAPNLESFTLEHEWSCLNFSQLSLPALDFVEIQMTDDNNFVLPENEDRVAGRANTLFQGVSHATTLVLDSLTIENLNQVSGLLEEMDSPFAGLQILMVKGTILLDHRLVTYLFGENDPVIERV